MANYNVIYNDNKFPDPFENNPFNLKKDLTEYEKNLCKKILEEYYNMIK